MSTDIDLKFEKRATESNIKLAVVKELIDILPDLDENSPKVDMLLANRLGQIIGKKLAEVENERSTLAQEVNARHNQLMSELEKYKNAESK